MSRPATAAVRLLSGEREPVRVATTANIDLYGLETIDGVALQVADRVLVKDQSDARENGIYTVSTGRWYRASDANHPRAINEGVTVQVQEGAANSGRAYRFRTLLPNIGADAIIVDFYLSANFEEDAEAIIQQGLADLGNLRDQVIDEIDDLAEKFVGSLGVRYIFDSTTAPNPADGAIRLSSSTQGSSNALYADVLDEYGADVAPILDSFDDSTSATKGSLRIYKLADPTKWLVFDVTAVASPAGYRNITVENVAASETSPFEDGDTVLLSFTPTGQRGEIGDEPAHEISGSQIRFQNPDGSWGAYFSLDTLAAIEAWDDFQAKYLGRYASAPATDPNGNAIQSGAFYWDTSSSAFFYWDGDSFEAFPFATVADGAVTTAKLANDAVTLAKFNSGVVSEILSCTALAAATVAANVTNIRVAGYAAAGDGGGHRLKRVAAAPSHGAGVRSADRFLPNGATDATNGGWWDVDEIEPTCAMFGNVASRTNAQRTASIQSMLDAVHFSYSGTTFRKCHIVNDTTITAPIVIPSYVVVEWHAYTHKGFNGDMILFAGAVSKLVRPRLYGNGATYTGRGIVISTGVEQVLEDPKITDMASYCLEFTTGEQGTTFRCNGGLLQSRTGFAVRMPASELTTTGFRWFTNVNSGGTPFIDFRNGNYTILSHCTFTELSYGSTTTGRTIVMGCRVATASGILVFGTEHQFSMNTLGGNLTFGSGTTRSKAIGNIFAGGFSATDSSGSVGANANTILG